MGPNDVSEPKRPRTALRRRCTRAQGLVLSCIVVLTVLLVLSRAHAKSRGVRLIWTSGPNTATCPSRTELMKSVVARLGYDPFSEDAPRIVLGSVAHTRDRYVITLQLVDGGELFSTRQLESSVDDCSAVTQAAAVSIAVDIQSAIGAGDERPVDAGAGDGGLDEVDDALDAGARDAHLDEPIEGGLPLEARGRRTSLEGGVPRQTSVGTPTAARGASVSVGPAVAVGLLPRLAVGIDVAGEVHFAGPLSASVGMTHFPEVEAGDPNFTFASTLVRGGACVELVRSSGGRLGGCAHVLAGSTTVIIKRLQPVEAGPQYFVAPALGLRFGRALGPVTLTFGANIHTPYPRHEFGVGGTNRTIFTAPLVAAAGYAEVGVGF